MKKILILSLFLNVVFTSLGISYLFQGSETEPIATESYEKIEIVNGTIVIWR